MPKNAKKRKNNIPLDVEFQVLAPKSKFKPFDEEAQKEEEKLTQILFGGTKSFLKSLEEAEQEPGPSCTNIDSGVGEDDSEDSEKERPPAWADEEDDGIEVGNALDKQGRRLPQGGINDRGNKYANLLKHKFTTIVGTPSWASLDKKQSYHDDSDDEILQTCGFVKKVDSAKLPPSTIEFKKVKDLNCETYSEGPYINAIEFHPTSSVALISGNSSIATLYAVDGKRNNKLHSFSFKKYPIYSAKFLVDGNEAILGSRLNYFYTYNLMESKVNKIPLPHGLTHLKNFILSPNGQYIAVAGKWGEIHILSTHSKERLFILKQNSDVTALAFSSSGNLLYSHSDSGEVTIFDMNLQRVKHKFMDDGCIKGTTIAISSSNQFVATGSAQGVVNIYNTEDVLSSNTPKPRKTCLNLTTSISDLKFNYSSEILAFSSSDIENSIRLLHLESNTVFNNFPSFGTKLGFVTTINFSPGGGYLAIGNKKSTVALYRLKHYKNY